MGKKRKQDQRRDDSSSSSSDAKWRRSRHYHVGETSRANGGTPPEGIVGVFRDAVLEFKDAIQVKVSTEAKFKRKINKLREKRKKDKEYLKKLEEDIRLLKEGHEDLKSKIQVMQKGGCAEVDHCRASPSRRSQPSESPRFNLRIETIVSSKIYKRETVTTKDGSGRIKVAMYDGGLPIASDHPLASVRVDLVVIYGSFNKGKKASWSREEFEKNIIKPRDDNSLVKNDTFYLNDGSCHHEGVIIMDNSQQKEVKLGVMISVPTEERVLEGVSNPFKVQESKTKVSKKKDKRPSHPVPKPNLVQPTSTHATQHGKSPVSPDEQHSLSPHVIQAVSQKEDRGKHTEFPPNDTGEDNELSYPPATVQQMVEGNGQANANSHRSSQQSPTQTLLVPTSTYSMQHGQGPVNPDEQQIQGLLQKADRGKHTEFPTDNTGENNGPSCPLATVTQMVEGNGEPSCLGLPLSCCPPPPSIQNPLQAAGHCPVNQPSLACGRDQYASFLNTSYQFALPNLYAPLNDIQWASFLEDETSVQTQIQETYGTYRCGRVLLQWDNPHVELKEHWNFLDQLMLLYSTKSRFLAESFPSTSFMDKAHKLLASISSGDSVSKMITGGTSQATQTTQRRGVLIRPIGAYDSDDEPPVKKQRNAKYQLRFVNRVRYDYYTREQIKSEDGNVLKVALYDENNLVVTSGPLSSACLEVVLLHGDFNAEGQDYWTPEEFSTCQVHPQSAKEPPALGGDRVLALTDGEADLGNVNFQTSSFHARTGKFKMGIVINKNVRDESVQEGITSPFAVRVRLGEEPSRHRITSLDALLRVKVKLPNQVCRALEHDARENVGSSLALHDQSSQVISILGVSMASDRPPEPSSQVTSVLWSSTASDRPSEPSSQVTRVLGASMASHPPPELLPQAISLLGESTASDRHPEPLSQVISVLETSTTSDRPPEPPSQVISDLGVLTASDRSPEPPSQVISDLWALTASDRPPPSQVISDLWASLASDLAPDPLSQVRSDLGTGSVLGASMASDRPPEPSWQGVEWSAPSALLNERKRPEDVKDDEDSRLPFINSRKRIEHVLLSMENNARTKRIRSSLESVRARLETLEREYMLLRAEDSATAASWNDAIAAFVPRFEKLQQSLKPLELAVTKFKVN